MTEQNEAADQPQADGQHRDPSSAPVNPNEGEGQASDRDAAIAAVDEQMAAENADDEPGDESSDDDSGEGGDDKDESASDEDSDESGDKDDSDDSDDSNDDADGDDEPPKKLSASVREAHRRQRSAARKLAEAQQVEQRNEERGKALDARDKEWTSFEVELKRNPLQAIAGRMGITVPRLIAAYGEDAKGDVPEAVNLEVEALRKELQEFKDSAKTASEDQAKRDKDARYQAALDNDAKLLSGMVDTDEVADRYPYFAALPDAQRVAKARSLQDYIVKKIPNPGQYSEDDLLEALDAKEKDRITKLEEAGVIKWLGRKKKSKDDADESNGNSKRPRTPSAKKAAKAAPKRKNTTDAQDRQAAIRVVEELRASAD
jgi:hypothetical protein